METIPDLLKINEGDGRLTVVNTQAELIDLVLCDNDFDCIFDELGFLLTE